MALLDEIKPEYYKNIFNPMNFKTLLEELNWVRYTETREEVFMAKTPTEYTYGKGKGIRTYRSEPYHPQVEKLEEVLFAHHTLFGEAVKYNVCFLNKYKDQTQHLGWHSDDSSGTDPNHPIAVVSFGEVREIWWRKKGTTGYPNSKEGGVQTLEPGSLFIMPAGFQQEYEHKIPKGNRQNMKIRISLTFRHIRNQVEPNKLK